jgi:formaldehyde-activating enzyme involved in methanogenesis
MTQSLSYGKQEGRQPLMVSKVAVKNAEYTNILMGTDQTAITHGVLDAVRAGDIPGDNVEHYYHKLGVEGEL